MNEKLNKNLMSTMNYDDKDKSFNEAMQGCVNELMKSKTNYSNKWFNNELKELREKRSLASIRANILNDTESWCEYRRIKNLYSKKLKGI